MYDKAHDSFINYDNQQKYWIQQDKLFCWHPFTQAQTTPDNLLITKAQGSYIYDIHGTAYLDAISSWWVNTHGHNHPHIINAITQQALQMAHVIFSGVTHIPAIKFAKKLTSLLPNSLQHVFFTDNGSTAIEAALKMAIQYAYNQHQQDKNIFLAFEGAYHGDTFGAMAVGKSSGFYTPFNNWLFKVNFIEYANSYLDSNIDELEILENNITHKLENFLQSSSTKVAAFIFEPLIQGASGMRICRVQFLNKILHICKKYNIICIADEVMTGFGRTGKLFACEYLQIPPDIICLSKGITGGNLAFGASIANTNIYNAFLHQDVMAAFLHGHSYTANPLACAAAYANLELFNSKTFEHINNIYNLHIKELHNLANNINNNLDKLTYRIKNLRSFGSIAAFDIIHKEIYNKANVYSNNIGQKLRLKMLQHNIILRPLGNSVYILPPYSISYDEIKFIYDKIFQVLKEITIDTPQEKIQNLDLF